MLNAAYLTTGFVVLAVGARYILQGKHVEDGRTMMRMGLWLMAFDFSYVGYLALSLLLACLGAVDELAFTSIYPELIPEGAEEKGYAVSSMLYPILKVAMTPLAAVLLDTLGVAWILIAQSVFSLAAAATESLIRLDETARQQRAPYSLKAWGGDTVTSVLETKSITKYSFTLLEVFGEEVAKLVFGTGNVTVAAATALAGTKLAILDKGDEIPRNAYVFEMAYGAKKMRYCFPDAQAVVTAEGPLVHNDITNYTVEITAYPNAAGVRSYRYLANDNKTS